MQKKILCILRITDNKLGCIEYIFSIVRNINMRKKCSQLLLTYNLIKDILIVKDSCTCFLHFGCIHIIVANFCYFLCIIIGYRNVLYLEIKDY